MNKKNLHFNGKEKLIQINQDMILIIENQISKKIFYNQIIKKNWIKKKHNNTILKAF